MRPPRDSLDHCPLAQTASIICDVWTPLIIRDLSKGPKRFSQLQRSVTGISPKTLSTRLKQLEQQGVIQRLAEPASARPRYELTPKGQALVPLIRDMRAYGRTWLLGDPADRHEEGLNQSAAAPAR
ncbi:HTH-type transcriptional regulator YodB [bacterium HR26]|nr:HTH-type transcriptional regulator YodB [bacterium HR26]